MVNKYSNIIIFIIGVLFLMSCSKTDNNNPHTALVSRGGVFIANEGNFSAANSSLSYYYPKTSIVNNNLFYQVNNVPLGDVAQSITINNNLIYIVVNNSGLIYVVNAQTLEFVGKITGLNSPREMIFVDDQKAYVSDLYSDAVTVINPQNYSIIGSVELGKSSDCMVRLGDKIVVANWSSYNQTSVNNTIMVIDAKSDVLIDSVVVGIEPNSMVIDKNNQIWVLCSGGYLNNEIPTLWKINSTNFEVEKQFSFGDIQQSPDNLCVNSTGDTLFFLNNGIWSMSITDSRLPENMLISENTDNYYSLAIHPVDNEIYVSNALDYNQNGIIYRYTTDGVLISSFEAGIIPGYFAFN